MSAGLAGTFIIDVSDNLNVPTAVSIPVGQTASWDVAYSVLDKNDIFMAITPTSVLYEMVAYTT